MNGTLQTGSIRPHNELPGAVWSTGGRHYDDISKGIADAIEHCVLRLNPQPGERILDLSTGTGWTSRLVARRGAAVIGADIATDLLEAARDKANFEGLDITYQIGDAEDLPFATGEFDAVVSTFGIMFASRPEEAAAELGRVCRKGGRIALTTWSSDGNLFKMFQVMRAYAPPSTGPAPRSPFEWGAIARLRELLGSAFALRFEKGVSYYREPTAEAAWDTFAIGYGPTRALAASLDPERRDALRADFIAFHAGFPTELGITVPREYWLTIGERV
jgi:SAM-dependent methyltransferase